ncbi:hypothetical protein P3C29_18665 [Pseudomonas sp. 1912-s]|uniref:hypothetical protein n=1 Tax=Pseudomonas sp. 1912-s TaxID=3033802 RepID=UPI0023DED0CB|nr:hypothetical protein [Pseudomonas sp. 1912-s]MDF3200712.1 hypothetical protein [Pseudomonas sp. 1912-s]
MLVVTALFGLFVIVPVVLGYAANVQRSQQKRAWYLRKYREVKSWTVVEYSLALFLGCTAVLYTVGTLAMLGLKLNPILSISLLSLTCLTALGYLYCYFDLTGKIKRYGIALKFLLGGITLCIATASKIYSDSGIAELTGLPPQDLPGAQLLLTVLLTPTFWLMALLPLAGYLSVALMVILFVRSMYRESPKQRRKGKKSSSLRDVSAVVAIPLCVLILFALTELLLSKHFYEKRLRQAIAFASFHLPGTYCGLPETKGVAIAPVTDGRAAIAIPDEKLGYLFEPIECKPAQRSKDDISALLNKVNLR